MELVALVAYPTLLPNFLRIDRGLLQPLLLPEGLTQLEHCPFSTEVVAFWKTSAPSSLVMVASASKEVGSLEEVEAAP